MTEADLNHLEELEKKATKPIPGYSGYEAGEDGSIWSVASNWRGYGKRQLKTELDRDGYLKVRLYRDGRRIKKQAHLLVCLAWRGERPTHAHEVRRLDGSRTNNNVSNLSWGTRSENALDRKIHGTERSAINGKMGAAKISKQRRKMIMERPDLIVRGERHGAAKLNKSIVSRIKTLRLAGVTWKQIGITVRHHPSTVRLACIGKTWKDCGT